RPTLPRRGNVRPAMVRHFMAVPHDVLASLRMALDGEARNEPGRPNAARAQQMPDALRADQSELAARERRGAPHPAGKATRLGIEVEREAYDMARHAGTSACYASCETLPRHNCRRHPHTGTRTVARRPPMGLSDRTMSPPCERAMSRAMARPSPVPPSS